MALPLGLDILAGHYIRLAFACFKPEARVAPPADTKPFTPDPGIVFLSVRIDPY